MYNITKMHIWAKLTKHKQYRTRGLPVLRLSEFYEIASHLSRLRVTKIIEICEQEFFLRKCDG